jgi:hypothetical protein
MQWNGCGRRGWMAVMTGGVSPPSMPPSEIRMGSSRRGWGAPGACNGGVQARACGRYDRLHEAQQCQDDRLRTEHT